MAQTVFPTKNNLMNTRRTLKLARTGYDLMDRKRKILVKEVMESMDEARSIQSQIAEKYKEAYDAMMLATVKMGDCSSAAESVPADDTLEISSRSFMGVEIPMASGGNRENRIFYSIPDTCENLDEAAEKFNELKQLTIRLAVVENTACRLADAINKTKKRTNALGNIMIPKLEKDEKFISGALEEKEREDFSRLKVSKVSK